MELRDYLQVVRRRRGTILGVLLLTLALAAGATALRTPVYEATARLLLTPNDPNQRVTVDPGGYFDPDRYAADQVGVLTSQRVVQRTARLLGTTPEEVLDNVTATAGDNSVVEVSARAPDARLASRTANALAQTYIDDRRGEQVAALRRAAAQIDVQLQALRSEIAGLRASGALPGRNAALDAVNEQYTSLFVRQRDLLIDAGLKSGDARLITPAPVPEEPAGLSPLATLLLGGLLGLVLGLGAAFLREQLDDRLRTREEVEELTGYPVLADLPLDRRVQRRPELLAMQHDPLGPLAEAVRTLRTSISFLGVEDPVRRLMVTSAVPGEGKTLVAANLAAAFAGAGLRTVLVSADLRRPRVEELLGVPESADGLSTLLVGAGRGGWAAAHRAPADQDALRAAVHQVLQDTRVPGLAFLPAGTTPPNPAELLGSGRTDRVLDELDQLFDVVVLDTTPVVPVTDAAALASKVGRVLLVASAGTSRRRATKRMLQVVHLTDAQVLGVVLNRVRSDAALDVGYYGQQQRRATGGRRRGRPEPVAAEPLVPDVLEQALATPAPDTPVDVEERSRPAVTASGSVPLASGDGSAGGQRGEPPYGSEQVDTAHR